jgi:hypothetical protein
MKELRLKLECQAAEEFINLALAVVASDKTAKTAQNSFTV